MIQNIFLMYTLKTKCYMKNANKINYFVISTVRNIFLNNVFGLKMYNS